MMCGMVASHHFIFFGGPSMRNFLLTRASLAFWIWCVPPFLWLLSTLPAEASLEERISALLLTWTWMLLGGAAINWYSRLLLCGP